MMTNKNNNDGTETKALETLRREYRNMEVNRKMFAEESSTILRRQQQTLEKLRLENENLKTDLATLQARTTLKPLNSFEQSQLDKVSLETERYKQLIDVEKSKQATMERQISMLREKIWSQRRKMGGSNAASENQRSVEKQVKMLENKLDQAVVKFNKSLSTNRKLREEIDNLRGERVAFEGVYKKLEKNLQERKRKMAQVIEQSNLAYEQRDKARLEIATIEQANKKEQETFDKQMDEMGKALEEEINAAAERRKNQQPHVGSNEEETKIAAEKAARANALLKEREELAKERDDKINNFEVAFRKIKEATGMTDVDNLVRVFQKNEEYNFSLFTFANAQADEIEGLEEQLQKLHDEEKISSSDTGGGSRCFEDELKSIVAKIMVTVKKSEKFEEKANQTHHILDLLKDGIKMLLTRLDFAEDRVGEIGINDANMIHFMGLIEERTNEILNDYYRYDKVNAKERGANAAQRVHNLLGPGPQSPKVEDNVCVNPPKLTDYSSDENSVDEVDDSRPLTIEELKLKTLNRMNRPRKKSLAAMQPPGGRKFGSFMIRRRGSLIIPQNLPLSRKPVVQAEVAIS